MLRRAIIFQNHFEVKMPIIHVKISYNSEILKDWEGLDFLEINHELVKLNESEQEVEIEYIKQEKGISLYGFSFQIYCRYRNINKVK